MIEWCEIEGKTYVLHSWVVKDGFKEYRWTDADEVVKHGIAARRKLAGWIGCV